ncbi:MAG: response regulator [Dehalococcoidia bacterium]|nr:response regulator [Dehalococcoidia bacterium]
MKQISVLILDDHAEVRALLARRLGSLPGFKAVAHSANPLLGAELARVLQPDIILADFQGRHFQRELYRWLARSAPQSQMVILTSYMEECEQGECLDAGAALCLLKGISLKELAEKLRGVVAGAAPAQRAGAGG